MSKKDDQITGSKEDPAVLPLPDSPSTGIDATDAGPSTPAPRATRFSEGKEERGARRERGASGAHAGFFERTAKFWHDVRAELKRVTWPTLKEVRSATIITIIAVIFFAVYLWAVDRVLAFLIVQLERFVNWLFGGV